MIEVSTVKIESPTTPVTYRPGTREDSYAVFLVFEHALADLVRRMGETEPTSNADPEALDRMWRERRPLLEHLADTASQFWIAEASGEIVGFSRGYFREGVQQLTEFFVHPEYQASGVGKELLARAFPAAGAAIRFIVATLDIRAQARYLKTGVYPRFPLYYFSKTPVVSEYVSDLTAHPITASPENLELLGTIDQFVLGHRRDADHVWLQQDRSGFFFLRDGKPVGYSYVGHRSGPFALLDPADYPVVLAHAENTLAQAGYPRFGLEVPMINQAAVDYLLARGFRMDSFVAVMMSSQPFGKFDQYIVTSPPFIL